MRQAVGVDAVVKGREITASPRISKDVVEAGHGNTNLVLTVRMGGVL